MSEQEVIVESQAAPEVQVQAEKMGWIPPSRFKGSPDKFVDADLYIERGETVLPIVREQNKRLHSELEAVRAESARTAAALKAAQTAIDQIEERHTVETQKAVEQARRQVKAQLAAASEAGDHEGVAELADQLIKLNETQPAPKVKASLPAPAPFVPDADLAAWNAENPWFGQNKRKTALALGIAEELRDKGEKSVGRAFFERVSEEMEKELGTTTPRGDKVEGSRGSPEGEGAARGGKGYMSLPADARQACDAEARRFVGEGKKYKTVQEWRNRYAEIYHGA